MIGDKMMMMTYLDNEMVSAGDDNEFILIQFKVEKIYANKLFHAPKIVITYTRVKAREMIHLVLMFLRKCYIHAHV